MAWWVPLAAAGAALAGGIMQNQASTAASESASRRSRESAREQMSFQERMSSTAHQRAVQDLREAGLNPILAAGSPASSPTGASAQSFVPHLEDPISKGIASGVQAKELQQKLDSADAIISLNKAQEKSEIVHQKMMQNSAKKTEAETKAINAQMGAIQKEAKAREKTAEYDEKAAAIDAILKRTSKAAESIPSAKSLFEKYGPSRQRKIEEKLNPKTGEIEKYYTP